MKTQKAQGEAITRNLKEIGRDFISYLVLGNQSLNVEGIGKYPTLFTETPGKAHLRNRSHIPEVRTKLDEQS